MFNLLYSAPRSCYWPFTEAGHWTRMLLYQLLYNAKCFWDQKSHLWFEVHLDVTDGFEGFVHSMRFFWDGIMLVASKKKSGQGSKAFGKSQCHLQKEHSTSLQTEVSAFKTLVLYLQQPVHCFDHQLEQNVKSNRKPWALHCIFRHYWNPQKTCSAFPPTFLRPHFSVSVVPVLHLFFSSGPPFPGNTELLGGVSWGPRDP